jgi:CheY-like chemotaxis protein
MSKLVLYAEDNTDDIFFLQKATKALGASIDFRAVPDGVSVIAWLTGEGIYVNPQSFPKPQVVVLGSKLVGMCGLETLRWIRSQPEFATLPVVMHSSSNLRCDIEEAMRCGATEYIVKDQHCTRLAHFLKILLDNIAAPANR